MIAQETSMLWPGRGFILMIVAYVVLAIAVPVGDAARRGLWGWVAFILLLSPLGGLLWYGFRLMQRTSATA